MRSIAVRVLRTTPGPRSAATWIATARRRPRAQRAVPLACSCQALSFDGCAMHAARRW